MMRLINCFFVFGIRPLRSLWSVNLRKAPRFGRRSICPASCAMALLPILSGDVPHQLSYVYKRECDPLIQYRKPRQNNCQKLTEIYCQIVFWSKELSSKVSVRPCVPSIRRLVQMRVSSSVTDCDGSIWLCMCEGDRERVCVCVSRIQGILP